MNHLEVMERRNKSLPTDLYGYKTGGMAPYGLDVLIPDKLDFDESRMSMSLPFADGRRRDGVGDLLEVGGIRTERHQKNAIVLFDHGKRLDLPIAMAWEWDNKAGKYDTSRYTVNIDPVAKTASLNAYFYQGKGIIPGEEGADRSRVSDHGLLCEQYYDLAVKGLLRGGSIGYQVVKALQLQPDYDKGLPQGLHLLSTTMLEGSLVVLPANMDTVQKMLSMPTCCGKPLSPYLIKSLQPYAPPRKAQMGYEGKAKVPGERFAIEGSGQGRTVYEVVQPTSEEEKERTEHMQETGTRGGRARVRTVSGRGHHPSAGANLSRNPQTGHVQSDIEGIQFEDVPAPPRKPRFPPGEEGQHSLNNDKTKQVGHRVGDQFRRGPRTYTLGRIVEEPDTENPNRIRQFAEMHENESPGRHGYYPPIESGLVSDEEWEFTGEHREPEQGEHSLKSEKKYITHDKGEYVVHSHTGKVFGRYKTKKEAENRLAQMEAHKALGQQPSIKSPSTHVGGNRLNRNNSVPGPGGYVPPNWKPGVGAMPQKSSGAIRNAKSLALRAKYGTSQKSIQAKEILSQIETKSLKDLRLKHRQVKGTRRKVKNTEHGSSILYVSGRDLEKVRNLAKDKGVTCKLLGTHHTGAEKVHLFGDDSIIDEISMQYGRPLKMFKGRGIKAIIVSNTKDGEGLKRIKAHHPGDKFKLGESVYEVISEGTSNRVPARTVSGPAHKKSPGKRVFPRCPDTGHVSTGKEDVQFENVSNKRIKALRKKYGKKKQVKAVRHPEDPNRWMHKNS